MPLDQLIPFQLGCILMESLAKVQAKMDEYTKLVDYHERAKKRFAELHAEDADMRKNRAGPYSC